eukprot:scaffold91_cov203-Alexandrium_tamarense.AAC.16
MPTLDEQRAVMLGVFGSDALSDCLTLNYTGGGCSQTMWPEVSQFGKETNVTCDLPPISGR